MNYTFHPEAWGEFQDSAEYYYLRQAGLELRFMDYVTAAIDLALDAPQRFRKIEGNVRRVLTPIFPYAALYSF